MPHRYNTFDKDAPEFEEFGNLRIYRISLPPHKNGMLYQVLSFIKFYIETDKGESKILELPYPFLINYTGTGVCTLNYRVSSICNNTQPVIGRLKACKTSASHKIYDSVVSIIPLN